MDKNNKNLINTRPNIINIGVRIFYDSLKQQNVKTIHVDWRPPSNGDSDLVALINKLT